MNTFTHKHTQIHPTNQPKKNVCYLKILNLNVNSRMKIYWIKNHVKQTIKKEYQKKKIAENCNVSIDFSFVFLIFCLAWFDFFSTSDCLSIGTMRIRARCCESCSKQQAVTKIHDRMMRGLSLNQQMAKNSNNSHYFSPRSLSSMRVCVFLFQDLIGIYWNRISLSMVEQQKLA